MFPLLIVASLGQCSHAQSYSFRSYTPTYQVQGYQAHAAPVAYKSQFVYQAVAPAQYDASLVTDYLRQESQYRATVEQNAKLDALLKLLDRPVVQAPAPQPQPQYQQPYQIPYGTPQQAPSKSPPYQTPPTPSAQYPTADSVPAPPPVPPKGQPTFGGTVGPTAWQSQAQGIGEIAYGAGTMTQIIRGRCAQCHTGTSAKGGGLKLVEIDGNLAADLLDHADDIMRETQSGRMPKGGQALLPQEMVALYAGFQRLASGGAVSPPVARANPSFGY